MCEDPKMIGVVNFRGPQLTGKVAAPDAPFRSKPVFVPVAVKGGAKLDQFGGGRIDQFWGRAAEQK